MKKFRIKYINITLFFSFLFIKINSYSSSVYAAEVTENRNFITCFEISSFLFYILITIFLLFIFVVLFYMKKIQTTKKIQYKLRKSREDVTRLYEELAASDEELRTKQTTVNSLQNDLLHSDEMYKLVIDASHNGIWDYDLVSGKLFFSARWSELFGFGNTEFTCSLSFFNDLIHPDDLEQVNLARSNHLENYDKYYETEFRLKIGDGSYKWVQSRAIALLDKNKKPIKLKGSHLNITELKEAKDTLHHSIYHDALTGLYNKLYLYEKIGFHLSTLKDSSKLEAMFFIDADNFKYVNDTLGHSLGDKLLIEISNRLRFFTGENSSLFRLGGDEFIIYTKHIDSRDEIKKFASDIVTAFHKPFIIDGNLLNITISMGISLFPENGTSIETLLSCADMAMYKIKQQKRNGYFFFNNDLNVEVLARVNIEKYFKKAMTNNEFILYYQPQVDIHSKEIISFEALIRWQSPELGFISPLKFISIAEETGFIIPLGEWILRSACSYINGLNEKNSKAYKISINISVIQLIQDNFTDIICNVLEDTGLPPELLELEITESLIMDSQNLVIEKLLILKEKGIHIALDDFGTGYSSLSYLRTIPINTLKIDKSFIDSISSNQATYVVTDSIIALGHKIGLTIIAEGVETKEQLDYLERNLCDKIQGYLFYKPLPPCELEKILNKNLLI